MKVKRGQPLDCLSRHLWKVWSRWLSRPPSKGKARLLETQSAWTGLINLQKWSFLTQIYECTNSGGSWKSTCLGSPLTSTNALLMYVNGWSVVICDWLSHSSKSIFLLIYVMNFHCKILTEWINVKNYCLGEHNQRVDQALVSREIRACPKERWWSSSFRGHPR